MKIFAPKYYNEFRCKAGSCRHSCCVGWEIDVDTAAASRYKSLGSAGERILATIDFESDTPHFKFTDGERCPHLDEHGLCRIISDLGEEYLCDICREHPRFYNFLPSKIEAGLGASCEEAARLILNSDNYSENIEVGELDEEEYYSDFDASLEREKIYKTLADESFTYPERLSRIYSKHSFLPKDFDGSLWKKTISELEYIDENDRDLFLRYSFGCTAKHPEYAERALAYFIYRHTGSSESYGEFRTSLGAALFLERLFVSLTDNGIIPTEALRIISEEIEYSEDNTERIKNEF